MANSSQNELVITDENGIEHVFPPGTDPQEANLTISSTPQAQGRAATARLTGGRAMSSKHPAQLSKGLSLTERALGAAPEIIGATVGGIAGTPAGPAGAGLGGMLGAGAGESIRQLLAASGVMPRAFGTLETAQPEKIRNAAMFGAATELGGAAVTKGLPTLFKRTLSPTQARDIKLLDREGIPFSAGDIHGGPTQIAENLMRGTLLGSGKAASFEQGQREAVVQFQNKVLNQFGPMMTKEELGEALQTAVKGRHQDLVKQGGIFDRAYRRVSTIFPAKVDTASIRREVAPIKAELDKLTAEGRIGAAAKSKESKSRFIELVDRLAEFGTTEVPAKPASTILDASGKPMQAATEATRKELKLTYQDVWKDKQSLDALVRSMSADDPLRTPAKGMLKRLTGILDNAMENAAEGVNPAAAQRIRNINKAYGETKRLFELDSPVARIGEMNPETIVQKFFQPGATTPPKELLTALRRNPEMLPPLRRRVAENLFEGIGKEVEGVRITPAGQLRERVLKSKDTLKTLFTPDQLNGLDEFINASERAQASGRMMNPASGRQLLAMSQLTGGGFLIGSGSPGTAATVVFGPAVLSRALFNPKIARLLATGFELKPGTAEGVKWSMRAINALRSVESQMKDENK